MSTTHLILPAQLLLIGWDDEKGRNGSTQNLPMLLAGASIVELLLREAVTVTDDRLHVVGTDVGDATLGRVLEEIRQSKKSRKVKEWVSHLGQRRWLRPTLLDQLVGEAVLRRESRKVLGVFTVTRFPVADRSTVVELRDHAARILTRPEPVDDARDAALGGLLHSGGGTLLRQLVPKEQRKFARERAKALSKGEAVSADVAKAIGEANAAVMTAVMAGAAAAVTSSTAGGS